jgi:mannose-6-phosphate isomerase-like protein (cupin superfamily)
VIEQQTTGRGDLAVDDFPEFMRNPANAVDPAQQNPGNVGYLFEGIDGTQIGIWTSARDIEASFHEHDFDEYVVVVAGEHRLILEGDEIVLRPGDEYLIPRGVRHGGSFRRGTRTIHTFAGRRAERAPRPG